LALTMIEPTAENYRRHAKQARAEAAAAPSLEFKRQWDEIAASYERLAAFVERTAVGRTSLKG
jgi:hypothetical protein